MKWVEGVISTRFGDPPAQSELTPNLLCTILFLKRMRFEVLTAINMKSWVLATCGFVERCLVTSPLKMETACFFETLASPYKSTQRPKPRLHQHDIFGKFSRLQSNVKPRLSGVSRVECPGLFSILEKLHLPS
jgi:hypothetical protein